MREWLVVEGAEGDASRRSRGAVTARARVTDGIAPGSVFTVRLRRSGSVVVVTILIGRCVERRILAKPGVATRLNRIRRWFGRPPFALDGAAAEKLGQPSSHRCGKGGRQ